MDIAKLVKTLNKVVKATLKENDYKSAIAALSLQAKLIDTLQKGSTIDIENLSDGALKRFISLLE